ncbi:hypothetical protein SmJEL517_g01946 [Synchytrium microbalum]|uniref:SH3 domain-containing protein n=1 Tax=Synchytrium microbalum TaxID=1806994 RepID=A0A507CDP6_9FUNG|nr:uncharacterized protein SmJEL517_g01946 [Synchytrium microbalum]TPX35663.1 hypothetical protein SmJEL517_g01946 [Synchytrium microbalum]
MPLACRPIKFNARKFFCRWRSKHQEPISQPDPFDYLHDLPFVTNVFIGSRTSRSGHSTVSTHQQQTTAPTSAPEAVPQIAVTLDPDAIEEISPETPFQPVQSLLDVPGSGSPRGLRVSIESTISIGSRSSSQRAMVEYEAQRSALSPPTYNSLTFPGRSLVEYLAHASYFPQQPDELEIVEGDFILIEAIYPDGWGRGHNVTTGLFGMVATTILTLVSHENTPPLDCLGEKTLQPAEGRVFDVMLSYNWAHMEQASVIADYLRSKGFDVWMDTRQLTADIFQSVAQSILSSKVVLLCLTAKYQTSNISMQQLRFALAKEKKIIVVQLDNGPFNDCMELTKDFPHLDLANQPTREARETIMQCLKDSILNAMSDASVDPWPSSSRSPRRLTQSTQGPPSRQITRRSPEADLKFWLKPLDLRQVVHSISQKRLSTTRSWLIREIIAWIKEPNSQVYWLSGVAGAGKSVIAASLVVDCKKDIAANFFCKFDEAGRNDPFTMLNTIAFQLALYFPGAKDELTRLFKEDPNFLSAPTSVSFHFESLIVRPMTLYTGPPCVIVIDALEECGLEGSRLRREVLHTLASNWSRLPPQVKLFMTSRPMRDIRHQFSQPPRQLDLGSDDNLEDIKLYALDRVSKLNRWLTSPDMVESLAEKLAQLSQGLFVWLYLACEELVRSTDPGELVNQFSIHVLGESEERMMSSIYARALIISHAGASDDSMKLYHTVVGAIVTLRQPLSVEGLTALLGVSLSRTKTTLARIEPLINVGDTKVEMIHKSLADFITSSNRCVGDAAPYCIDTERIENMLAERCLDLLCKNLALDQSKLPTQVDRLNGIIDESVAPYLRYVCQYAIEHLNAVQAPDRHLIVGISRLVSMWASAPLLVAVSKGCGNAVKHLLVYGGGHSLLEKADNSRYFTSPLLCEATTRNSATAVENLIRYGGASVEVRDPSQFGFTPLLIAAGLKTGDVFEVLASHGADLNAKSTTGQPIDVFAKSSTIMRLLVAKRRQRYADGDLAEMDELDKAVMNGEVDRLREVDDNTLLNHRHRKHCQSLLHIACEYNQMNIVVYLVEKAALVNSQDKNGCTPLHYAVDHLDIVKYLVKHHANPFATSRSTLAGIHHQSRWSTPLHVASERDCRVDVVEYLSSLGPYPTPTTFFSATPLSHAAAFDCQEMAKYLIAHGADVNASWEGVTTPLGHACMYGHYDMAKMLLDAGANPHIGTIHPPLKEPLPAEYDSPGYSALGQACYHNNVELCKLLLARGADVNSRNVMVLENDQDVHSWTNLGLAAYGGNISVMKVLLDAGARLEDMNVESSNRQTALHFACSAVSINAVKVLLDAGASVDARSGKGDTALHKAVIYRCVDIARLLILRGSDMHAALPTTKDDCLHIASKLGDTAMVKVLVDLGCCVDGVNCDGDTALHVAVRESHLQVVRVLIGRGAKFDVENGMHLTAKDIAIEKGNKDVIRLLQ